MKISKELYTKLRISIGTVLADSELSIDGWKRHYNERGWTMNRMRWQLLHHTGALYELYTSGLDDSHIDTALRRITGTK